MKRKQHTHNTQVEYAKRYTYTLFIYLQLHTNYNYINFVLKLKIVANQFTEFKLNYLTKKITKDRSLFYSITFHIWFSNRRH